MTVLVGAAFIVAVSQVYYGGLAENPDYPFEIARIREHILLPFIFLLCWIAAIIVGAVLSFIYPVADKKSSFTDNSGTLEKLKARIPTSGGEEFTAAGNKLSKYGKIRTCVFYIALAVFLAAAIAIFVYAFNITHYHADALKSDILELVKNVLSWTVAAFAVGIAAACTDEILIKRSIAEAKTAIVRGDRDAKQLPKEVKRKTITAATVAAGIVVGVALLAYGIAPLIIQSTLGGTQTVIYAVAFVFAALTAAGFAVYNTVKRYIPDKVNGILLLASRIVIGCIAVVFIVVGVLNGGANDVLVKAINICTECIGLG